MIQLKEGVKVTHLTPQLLLAIHVVDGAYESVGIHQCFITSLDDGKHGPTTLHGTGQAADFRLHNVPQMKRPALVERIKVSLRDQEGEYEVYWEGVGTDSEHLHVEYQPK